MPELVPHQIVSYDSAWGNLRRGCEFSGFFAIKLFVSGNWESYCLTRCAQVVSRWKHWVCHRERMVHEAECGTPCGGKIPRGFVVLRRPAALHCLTPPWGKEGNIFQTSSTSSAVGQPCKSLVDAISLNQACWISGNTICSGITTFPYVLVPKNKNTIRNGGRLDICNKILQLQFLRQKVTPKNA